MSNITFLELMQDSGFRSFVERQLAEKTGNNQYLFSEAFPPLYRYCSLSSHAIDDIVYGSLTATRIGEFNDLFDGALHRYGTEEERQSVAEADWDTLERYRLAANLPTGTLQHDNFVNMHIENYRRDSRMYFRTLDYLGTYVACFSADRTSILMWSHYANYNMGMCIEYNFNSLASDSLLRKVIFPIAYSQKPINLQDLLADKESRKIYEYPLDAAVLCAALNKSDEWRYENEWRLMFVLYSGSKASKRFPVKYSGVPSSISLGYHFLKPFFYHDSKNEIEVESAKKHIKDVKKLLEYVKRMGISISVMVPSIGNYQLKPLNIPIDSLLLLMTKHFQNDKPENMHFYYVVHDELMELAEKETQNA